MKKIIYVIALFSFLVGQAAANDSVLLQKMITEAVNCYNYYTHAWTNNITRNIRLMRLSDEVYLASLDRHDTDSRLTIRDIEFGRDHILLIMINSAEGYGRVIQLGFYSSSEDLRKNTSSEKAEVGIPYAYREQIHISPQQAADFLSQKKNMTFEITLSPYSPTFDRNHTWQEIVAKIEGALYRMMEERIRRGWADDFFATQEHENACFYFNDIDYKYPLIYGFSFKKAKAGYQDLLSYVYETNIIVEGLYLKHIDFRNLYYRTEKDDPCIFNNFFTLQKQKDKRKQLVWKIIGDEKNYRLERIEE